MGRGEELERLPAGTQPSTAHRRSPGSSCERGVERGSARQTVDQTNNGTVSKAALRKTSERDVAHIMDLSGYVATVLN